MTKDKRTTYVYCFLKVHTTHNSSSPEWGSKFGYSAVFGYFNNTGRLKSKY